MKIADVLRRLASTLDGHAQGGSPDPGIQNPAELQAVPSGQHTVVVAPAAEKPSPGGVTASGNDENPEIFLPPLQQKQELLKKAVGVENVYDDGTPEQQHEQEQQEAQEEDELERIKRSAGLNAVVVSELGDSEPLES
jgi:hypothetical protein